MSDITTGTGSDFYRLHEGTREDLIMHIHDRSLDDQLLAIYVNAHDLDDREEALRRIEGRYAKLVWNTVQGCLGDNPRVGEAVQATFVVMARRAKDIHHPLPQWLRQTATRTAYHVAA